jgi:uncharacterized protein with FMN-binding domain
MKELIYTAIFAGLGILLIVLLLFMFLPKEKEPESVETMRYTPGVYTSSVTIQSHAVDVQVIVDENRITSVSLVNLDETIDTMYPLIEPAMDSIRTQVLQNQSTEEITYSSDNQYTSMILLSAISDALKKAEVSSTQESLLQQKASVLSAAADKARTYDRFSY